MDQLSKSVLESEELGRELGRLRSDRSLKGLVAYNEALLEAVEKQINIYNRLRLMGDEESVQIADEMELVAFNYLGRPQDLSMNDFFKFMKNEIIDQLGMLSMTNYYFDADTPDSDDWFWS